VGTKKTKPLDASEIELRPDGLERFRSAVHAAAKIWSKHRSARGEPSKSAPLEDNGKP
jgi:hypothetical protein